MRIGLLDVDAAVRGKVTFPNLTLMKISTYWKMKGASVEWWRPGANQYDIVYMSKVFGDEYTEDLQTPENAGIVVRGGSGYAISISDGKERYCKSQDPDLPEEMEHVMPDYKNVENVCLANRYVNGPAGAKCTQILKKRVRKKWESEHPGRHTYIWGFDVNEKARAERLVESMPEFDHEFPLIERGVTKKEAHGICASLGLSRPTMYDLGYSNNNCVGCVKGGMGYWNKIRVDFPEVFKKRAKMERAIGRSCIKGVFLDELDPKAGRMTEEILPECGIACELLDTEVLLGE